MAGAYDRMTDGPCWWWCRLRPKDLPAGAGAHFGIAGTALVCSFHRYEEGLGMVIGLSHSEKLNCSDKRYKHYPSCTPMGLA
jgi:hypothetical protein